MQISDDLKGQIEKAFDYRGHVTLSLKDGSSLEGFVFNRLYAHPKGGDSFYVDLIVKNKELSRRVSMTEIQSIALTGEDCAAGKSYADYLAKKAAGKV